MYTSGANLIYETLNNYVCNNTTQSGLNGHDFTKMNYHVYRNLLII